MAYSIADYLCMKYLFKVKDKRKLKILKQLFYVDMQYNLTKQEVEKPSELLKNPKFIKKLLKIYIRETPGEFTESE